MTGHVHGPLPDIVEVEISGHRPPERGRRNGEDQVSGLEGAVKQGLRPRSGCR